MLRIKLVPRSLVDKRSGYEICCGCVQSKQWPIACSRRSDSWMRHEVREREKIRGKRGRGRLCSHPLPTPSLFSLVTSLYAVPAWSECEEKVKWRSKKLERQWTIPTPQNNSQSTMVSPTPRNIRILGLQPRDKAAMLGVKTIELFSGRIYMKKEFSSQRRGKLFSLTSSMAAVTSRANQQLNIPNTQESSIS